MGLLVYQPDVIRLFALPTAELSLQPFGAYVNRCRTAVRTRSRVLRALQPADQLAHLG